MRKTSQGVFGWVAFGLLALLLLAPGCTSTKRVEPPPPAATGSQGSAQVLALNLQLDTLTGREIYKASCMTCHGIFGDGRGPQAKWLDPKPRDFTKGLYKWRTTPFGALPTDSDLERVIRDGVSGTDMFPFGEVLARPARMAVVQYIKRFSPQFSDPAQQKAAETVIKLPQQRPFPPSEQTVAQGKALYTTKGCSVCHGDKGSGDGPAAGALVDGWGDPIRPWNFRHAYYKSGNTDQDLFRTISMGLNGTPMPGYMALTSEEERWQLVDFIRSLGRGHHSLLHYLFVDSPGGQVYDKYHSSTGF